MFEQNQDREMLDAFQRILDFVNGDIPNIPGNWFLRDLMFP